MSFFDTFFNTKVMAKYLQDILHGLVVTVELAILIVISGLLGGLALALVRSLGIRPLNESPELGLPVCRRWSSSC